MPSTLFSKTALLLCTCFLSFMISFSGCQLQNQKTPVERAPVQRINKLVTIGFHPAMPLGESPGIFRSPVSGTVFMAEPVPESVADMMTSRLFDRLVERDIYDLISPNQAKGVYSSLVSSDRVLSDIEIAKKIGQAFEADAVLLGHLYRWREREGANYAVRRAASVAFDLYLVRASDGAILMRGKFDKTQRSLSENVFDLETFMRSGGKWMTVEKLAEFGLSDILAQLPKGVEVR